MKFLLALASVFVGTVNAEVESGTSPELTTSSMLSALASGSVSAFGNMEAALLNQPYPENFECIELDQYYGSCPYKCDCDTTRTMITPDGRVVVIYMACGDLFSSTSSPGHCYFPTPRDGSCYGRILCDWPALPARIVPPANRADCERSTWEAYLDQRALIEYEYTEQCKQCASVKTSAMGACNGKLVYDCACMHDARMRMLDRLDLEYRIYRNLYFVFCAPCVPIQGPDMVPWSAECHAPQGFTDDCWATYQAARTNADAVYWAAALAANGDCDKIDAALATLVATEATLHQNLVNCCIGHQPG